MGASTTQYSTNRAPVRKTRRPMILTYCRGQDCGDPIPMSNRNSKRQMIFVGISVGGYETYMCPVCGKKRYFAKTMFGSITERPGPCFVATVVYQSDEAPEVRILRKFRDEYLNRNIAGRIFIRSYYQALGPIGVKLIGLSGERGRRIARRMIDRLVALIRSIWLWPI